MHYAHILRVYHCCELGQYGSEFLMFAGLLFVSPGISIKSFMLLATAYNLQCQLLIARIFNMYETPND